MVKVKRGQDNAEAVKNNIVNGMLEKKAEKITVIDLKNLFNPITEKLVICTASSDKNAEAIANEIERTVFLNLKEHPWITEGKGENQWIILDYVNVIAHIFLAEKRDFFALEELWGDGKITRIEPKTVQKVSVRDEKN